MNRNLLKVVQQITTQYGEDILGDAKRLKSFFGDLAKDDPKPLRTAFCRAVEEGAYNALKAAPDAAERAGRKTSITQRVRDEHGIDPVLSIEALDILDAALFGEENVAQTQAPPAPDPQPKPKPVTGGTVPPAKMKLYLENIKKFGAVGFSHVPEDHKTAELCLAAVQQEGWALQYVPERLKTAGLCLTAVKQSYQALKYVPPAYKTVELLIAAAQQYGGVLRDVPEELKTVELCLASVRQDSWMLEYVPKTLMTAEVCLAAVQQNSGVLSCVPKELKAQVSDSV
jgi:hypothetical protein